MKNNKEKFIEENSHYEDEGSHFNFGSNISGYVNNDGTVDYNSHGLEDRRFESLEDFADWYYDDEPVMHIVSWKQAYYNEDENTIENLNGEVIANIEESDNDKKCEIVSIDGLNEENQKLFEDIKNIKLDGCDIFSDYEIENPSDDFKEFLKRKEINTASSIEVFDNLKDYLKEKKGKEIVFD